MAKNRLLTDELRDTLSLQIDKICDLVKDENQQHRTDLNDTLENVFCKVLNIHKSLKLKNLNRGSKQVAGIDLGDNEAKVTYQITAESSPNKVHECLDQFEDKRHFKVYDELIIFFANDYQTKLSSLKLKEYSFDPNKITTISNKNILKTEIVNDCELGQLQEIVEYLEQELSPLVDNPVKSVPIINAIIGKCIEMMKTENLSSTKDQSLPTHLKEKISLNFEDSNEADQVTRYMQKAFPYGSIITEAINEFPELDSSDLEEYMMDVYNRANQKKQKPMEILIELFDHLTPDKGKTDLLYRTWSRRFVLKYFENCTIFKRSKTEIEQATLL